MEKWNLPRSPISERSDELFDTLVSSFGATRTSDFFLVRRRAIFEKSEDREEKKSNLCNSIYKYQELPIYLCMYVWC